MNKLFKNLLLLFAISVIGNSVFASDNVLQAIQVDGVKDSYNIILKSDDVADMKKTIQAPNKMVINLKGIRASKTINTIYNNTANVDSVVVEPTGDDSVTILVQAANVANAEVHFDSLKTPLGVLSNTPVSQKKSDEITLSDPMTTYSPVYNDNEEEDQPNFIFDGASNSIISIAKNALKSEKLSWLVACALFAMVIMSGIKTIKGNDNEIHVGLTQSLKDREIALYGGLGGLNLDVAEPAMCQNRMQQPQSTAGVNYGLKAYQDNTRSPYITQEIQRPRSTVMNSSVSRAPIAPQPVASAVGARQSINTGSATLQSALKSNVQTPIQRPQIRQNSVASKTTNIDSIKFLESMTKIYEKSGRTDLAQGLKANMKKAKSGLA